MSNFKINQEDLEKLNVLTTLIEEQTKIFTKNDTAFKLKGNKQAAKRARVASLRVFKATKTYRSESMRILSEK